MRDANRSTTKKGSIETSPLSHQMPSAFGCAAILGVCMCFVTVAAHAQQGASSSLSATAKTSGGWWSPDRNESTLVVPRLNLGMAKLVRFETAEGLQTSTRQGTYPITEYENRWSHAGFEFTQYARGPEFSTLANAEPLPSGSFFSFGNAKYLAWETAVSDSRSLTDVNGVLVYPLMEIHYAHWHLPIAMYISPLRGSASR